ncbi:MAG TPA: acetylornithine deacetylase [Myxococcales bacterium]|jgi:acetylornithine deacetylase
MIDPRRALAALVGIDSVSSKPNAPVVDYLAEAVEGLGLKTRRIPYADEAGVEKVNLLAATRFDAPPALALVGHTDTVPFDPSWAQALCLEEADGRLWGRGACDTKGFIACALAAASRTDLRRLQAPLMLVFTADEEVGCLGAKKLAEARALFPRHAIVGEPTNLTPIRAHKGYCIAKVEVIGREGHSAYPALGASAILAAGALLSKIDEYARSLDKTPHLRLVDDRPQPLPTEGFDPPHTTLNVGLVQGGQAPNVIPGSCRFVLEWRPLPGESPTKVLDAVRAMAHHVSLTHGVGVSVKGTRLDKGIETSATSDLVRLLSAATGNAPATVSYHTEAPQLAELGAQVAVFGPGDIKLAHATGENVPVADLEKCTEVLTQAIFLLCGGAS